MKKIILLVVVFLALNLGLKSYAQVSESTYCAVPPFLSSNVAPNVMLVQDVSGSMAWSAYNPDSNGQGYCGDIPNDYDQNGNVTNCPSSYSSSQTYEGYFIPQDIYSYDSNNNLWYIDNSATKTSCPASVFNINSNSSYSGNCLNFLTMSRSDLVKWTMTGGEPLSCATGSSYNGSPYNNPNCDPLNPSDIVNEDGYQGIVLSPSINEYYGKNQYNYPNAGYYVPNWDCYYNNYCTQLYFSVLTPLSRIQQAMLPSLTSMSSSLQPRIGLLMFTTPLNSSSTPYTIPYTVYIGGYPYNQETNSAPSNFNGVQASDPYSWVMRYMNYQMPIQGTPTGPALQDVIDYFSQKTPTYSYGFKPGLGTWMDPLYECDANRRNCQAAPCAQNFVILMSDGGWDIPDCSLSSDPVQQAYAMHTGITVNDINGISRSDFSNITVNDLYAIYLGNLGTSNYQWPSGYGTVFGQNALENIAYFGSFEPLNSVNPSSFPSSSCTDNTDCQQEGGEAQGSLCQPLPLVPNTFFAPNNASQIKSSLMSAFSNIIKQASSATSVSSQSQKTQTGSSLVQAIFYPQKVFDNNTTANWVGFLYDWWLYSPVGSSTINILNANTSNLLEPFSDYTLNFVFQNNQLMAQEWLNNTLVNTVSIDQLNPVWEAGKILWQENPQNRTIYTTDGTSLIPFTTANANIFSADLGQNLNTLGYLCNGSSNCSETDAVNNLITYIDGTDLANARNRTVTIGNTTNVWKLGDIIYSTPQVVQYNDWVNPSQTYNVVYVGANDGMLHAFSAGQIQNINLPSDATSKICDSDNPACNTNNLGKELWAFIPQDALPYLRFLADPNYCHIYFNDLTPYIFRANGHVILIEGMRLGGANGNGVQPPSDVPSGIGYSAYYALDVTNPTNPIFLWEFSNPNLGFTFSGPAVINVNGQYFVMFLSGPTDYQGDVNQPLDAFVLSLNSDFSENSVYNLAQSNQSFKTATSNMNNAYGGRLFTQGIIDDSTGNTIAVPFGVSIQTGNPSNNTWHGSLMLMQTNNSTNPNNWTFTKIMDTTNPITAKVVHMQCFNETYLYFGTGKYFFKSDNYNPQNPDNLYGVDITGCLNGTTNCSVNASNSQNNACTELTTSQGNGLNSWNISLSSGGNGYLKERDITDPTPTSYNVIFFTTTEPTSNICGFGGQSRVWGLNCATGSAALDTSCSGYIVNNIPGTLFLQTSTGAIHEVNPNTTFTTGTPTTSWQTGIPPESSTSYVAPFTGQAGIIIEWKQD